MERGGGCDGGCPPEKKPFCPTILFHFNPLPCLPKHERACMAPPPLLCNVRERRERGSPGVCQQKGRGSASPATPPAALCAKKSGRRSRLSPAAAVAGELRLVTRRRHRGADVGGTEWGESVGWMLFGELFVQPSHNSKHFFPPPPLPPHPPPPPSHPHTLTLPMKLSIFVVLALFATSAAGECLGGSGGSRWDARIILVAAAPPKTRRLALPAHSVGATTHPPRHRGVGGVLPAAAAAAESWLL